MRAFVLASVSASLFSVAGAAGGGALPAAAVGDIDVMTQNQYLGADLFPLIAAFGTPQFNDAVVGVVEAIAASRTSARVDALAAKIAARKPHLVGLQEMWSLACIPAVPELGGYPCTDPHLAGAFADHLTLTLDALGGAYTAAAVVADFKLDAFGPYPGVPFSYNDVPGFLQIVDRDVILARSDVPTTVFTGYPCTKPSADGCNFEHDLPLTQIGTSVKRGFVIVDATVGDRAYRFVDTHLENEAGPIVPGEIQSAQAAQLIETVLGTTPPGARLIVVGDTNSDPDDPPSSLPTPYEMFAAAGLFDAWSLRPGNAPGPSCCQLADLSNRVSILARRVDLILTREMPIGVKRARLIGEVAADRLRPPGARLWLSDHAAVAAGLRY